jgi:hypothetical protein
LFLKRNTAAFVAIKAYYMWNSMTKIESLFVKRLDMLYLATLYFNVIKGRNYSEQVAV